MRRRIMLLVVGMTALVVLAFAIPLAVLIRHNVYDAAVKDLQDTANRISAYLHGGYSAPSQSAVASTVADFQHDRSVSVQYGDGYVIGHLPPGNLPPVQVPQRDQPGNPGGGPGGPAGPTTTNYQGGKLVQLVDVDPDRGGINVIRVYASDGQLHSGETPWWGLLGGVAAALIVLGVVAGELLTRRIVRPLVETARTAQQLSTGDTTARASTKGPREIGEVGVALNRLADRIDELIAEERETVADLSHRLRTPLTALRLDAEALHDPTDAERVGQHVSALERMLTAVIHAARRPQREGRMPSCDATAVVGERVAWWSALAEDQERTSSTSLPSGPVVVRAAAEDLAAAVDALLENVVAHTPEGTSFAVRLTGTDAGARLEVSDDGPGLPPDEPVRGRSDRGSSGLGLDIARRCAEGTGGSLTLGRSPSGGALITLDLRRA